MLGPKPTKSVVWKSITGNDKYGKPITTDTTILVWWEGGRRLVRDSQGKEVVSEARLFTDYAIKAGDFINPGDRDWEVLAVSEKPDLSGVIDHYEVAV